MKKYVYAYDHNTSVYTGPVELTNADLSPMEPGVWLIPGNCLEVAPPLPVPAGKQLIASNGIWALVDLPAAEVAADPAPAPAPAPEPTFDDRAKALRDGVQTYMDHTAQAYGYDDIKTAVTYADEPSVEVFQLEGLAFRAWRSLVWAFCYGLLAKVKAGTTPEPTLEELLPTLPMLDMSKAHPPVEVVGPPAPAPAPAPAAG